MTKSESFLVRAREGRAFRVEAGTDVQVVNTHGTQVVDTWAFNAADPAEFMSMDHSRLHMGRLNPIVGDTLVTNRRRAILTLKEDTSGGVHDTLLAACDRYRYELLGYSGKHDNCTDNLHAALHSFGLRLTHTPAPLNLFENSRPDANGMLAIKPPISSPGSYVTLRAEMDIVLVFSACPQDMVPTNGVAMRPCDVQIQIYRSTPS
jgi:uncharacterized protein YcgI (DUF1989 family)